MTDNLPVPVPVYIQSFTGFGLKWEFVEFLYNAIIDLVYRKYDIQIDAVKMESYLDRVDVIIGYHRFWVKDSLQTYRFSYCEGEGYARQYAEDRLSHFAYGLVHNLKVVIEMENKHD